MEGNSNRRQKTSRFDKCASGHLIARRATPRVSEGRRGRRPRSNPSGRATKSRVLTGRTVPIFFRRKKCSYVPGRPRVRSGHIVFGEFGAFDWHRPQAWNEHATDEVVSRVYWPDSPS